MTPNPPHILIVDDHREIRDALAKYLEKNGMRATSAANAVAMDAALKVGQFDLIVLDVMMPGEDGLSVCRRLRAAGNMPILMLTALGDETDRIVGLEVGADDYLPKPFNPRELLARIKAILRRSDRARRAGAARRRRRALGPARSPVGRRHRGAGRVPARTVNPAGPQPAQNPRLPNQPPIWSRTPDVPAPPPEEPVREPR